MGGAADELRAGLAGLVGDRHVLVDGLAPFEVDWTGRFVGRAAAVVRPATVDEVAAVVRWCATHRVPIVPQGGNTGLVGGSVPDGSGSAVVLSTRRLDRVRDVDVVAGQVTAEAGVTLEALGDATAGTGWEPGVDLGARGSATIGGMVATNAGGVRVLRHGSMRAQVLGVEAVLGDGRIVSHLGGLVKDNTGYDLAGLLCGSEGTLGVVTAARLRLVPTPTERVAIWIACPSWADAVELASALRRRVDGLDGLEAVDHVGLALVEEELGVRVPLRHRPPVGVLVVWAGAGDPPAGLVEAIGDREHAVVATGAAALARAWAPRELQAEAIARRGVPHKLDVTLPLAGLASFVADLPAAVGPWLLVVFGHLGDGNLHVNVVGPAPDDESVDDAVLALVTRHRGSISAEHGIGRAKARWLRSSRSTDEVAAFTAIRRALDPAGIMNPGVLLAEGDGYGPGHAEP